MEQITITNFEKKFDNNGYISIFTEDGWIKEHRYVMSIYLGRELINEEKVHHDDFNKQNNNILNLTLFPTNKAHSHFHRQIKQFGMTRPRINDINLLKQSMEMERINNLGIGKQSVFK